MAHLSCHMPSVLVPIYAIALFTPTIIKNLGYKSATAQLMSIPLYVCGCISTIIISILSDKMNSRGPFILLGVTISMIGYIIAYITSKPGLGYGAAIIAATGVFPCIPVMLAWAGGNAGGDMKRGVVLAMVIGIGNLGGYVSRSSELNDCDVGMQYLLLIHILPTTAIPSGSWHYPGLS
jgi:hypothetical protein